MAASTALRAYRNRHLGTRMPCCAAWEPVGRCFDQCSFECVDFHGLSQISASLTQDTIAEREAAIHDLPWTQTEKDNVLAKCRLSLRARSTKNRCSVSMQIRMTTVISLRMKTGQAGGYATSVARFLSHASKASGIVQRDHSRLRSESSRRYSVGN